MALVRLPSPGPPGGADREIRRAPLCSGSTNPRLLGGRERDPTAGGIFLSHKARPPVVAHLRPPPAAFTSHRHTPAQRDTNPTPSRLLADTPARFPPHIRARPKPRPPRGRELRTASPPTHTAPVQRDQSPAPSRKLAPSFRTALSYAAAAT